MDVQYAFFENEGKPSRNYTTWDLPTPPLSHVLVWRKIHPDSLSIWSVLLCVWSGGSPPYGQPHFHSLQPILLWLVRLRDRTQLRATRECLPHLLPGHQRWRPQVKAAPQFVRISSTYSSTWWTDGRCRCLLHSNGWTQACWRLGWPNKSSPGIYRAIQQ